MFFTNYKTWELACLEPLAIAVARFQVRHPRFLHQICGFSIGHNNNSNNSNDEEDTLI